MDIKEIREDLDTYCAVINQNDWTGQLYSLACSLLSEVEGLQNTIAQMQDVEQTIYECRMKGGDAVRHLLDSLLAENKQLKTEVERLEKENAELKEELEATRGSSWNPNSNECEFCRKTKRENAALKEVMEAAKKMLSIGKINKAEDGIALDVHKFMDDMDALQAALEKLKEE